MQNQVVSREEWLKARTALLEHEKALTRHRDEVSAERLALPWVRIEKAYVFDGPDGKLTLEVRSTTPDLGSSIVFDDFRISEKEDSFAQWAGECGDPRGGTTDPADFVECIPFAETRNYVMRIMEGVQVYRARLGGGVAPLSLIADLKRGGWTPSPSAMAMQGAGEQTASGACVTALPTMATWQPNPSAPLKTENC